MRAIACALAATIIASVPACSVTAGPDDSATSTGSKPATVGEPRATAIISDLHLGVGRDKNKTWHPYEDFRWEREFRLFLLRLKQEGGGRTDLILNGDTFELWQSLEHDCKYANTDLGCTEAEAVRRVRRVLSEHKGELDALSDFASSGENTVTIVPGNHDAALLFPAVARAVLGAFRAPSGRVKVAAEGHWISRDGLVYAEHGHQIGEEVNRFHGWPLPFLQGQRVVHLRRPWGEQFVQAFYNRYEAKYPIVDNVADERDALRFAMAAEGRLGSVVSSAEFMKFFLLDVSWRQLSDVLGEEGEPTEWDTESILSQGGHAFILESLPEGDPLRAEVERAARERLLGLSVAMLSEREIRAICDLRAIAAERVQADPEANLWSKVERCPVKNEGLGAIGQSFVRSRDDIFGAHLKHTAHRLGQAANRRFGIFVYSHTHRVARGFNPLRAEGLGWDPYVVNSGAWQRVVSAQTLRRMNPNPAEALRGARLEQLPGCYTVVWIAPYAEIPAVEIRSWRENVDGSWEFGPMCDS